MRKARLLSTVAATLLLTVGVASAQTMKNDEAPGRTPAAQQKAPAEKVAPAMKPGEQKAGTQKAPETIGQAKRISGITPAAITLLLVHLKRGFRPQAQNARRLSA